MRLLSAVESSPGREVALNCSASLLFHGGNTGSIPVRDAKLVAIERAKRKLYIRV